MKILVVDDDFISRSIIKDGLELSGYSDVILADSGMEALTILDEDGVPFDCLMLDIQMPGIDGIELCSKIRDIPIYKETPIIMVTALHEKSYVEAALLVGATDYITKPFEVLDLVARVGSARKLSEQYKIVAEKDESISELTKLVKSLNSPSNEIPVVVDTIGFVEPSIFETTLQQIPHAVLIHSALESFRIENFHEISSDMDDIHLFQLISDVANVVSEFQSRDGRVYSYFGHGKYVCLITNGHLANKLTSEDKKLIQEELNRMTMDALDRPKLFMKLTFGNTIDFNQISAEHPVEILHSIIGEIDSQSEMLTTKINLAKSDPQITPQMELELRMKRMVPQYLAVLNKYLARLETLSGSLVGENSSIEEIKEIMSIAHKISGVAPTLGFGKLGKLAADTEKLSNNPTSPINLIQRDLGISTSVNELLDEIEETIVNSLGE